MYLPLVDSLRCPKVHAETWLVAQIERIDDRDIVEGVLGCPECLAEYAIHDGVVRFDERAHRAPFVAPAEEDALRLAAALDLTDARMTAILHGRWGACAPIIAGLSPAHLLLVNPPEGIASGDGVSIIVGDDVRIASASMSAAAFDATATPSQIAAFRAAVKGGGRFVGPSDVPIPGELTELARDESIWIGQVPAGMISQPVMPTRRSK
ncbi:MAG TPA: hypothetical protein VHB25_03630 [Gemmatimonadaceae bacterium]|nr:hypothetical protein [Gemmatimonadaceae bacterium]